MQTEEVTASLKAAQEADESHRAAVSKQLQEHARHAEELNAALEQAKAALSSQQLRPHAADLEQQLGQCQVKVKAAQADVTDLRAEALHSKVRVNFAVLRVPQYLCTLAL